MSLPPTLWDGVFLTGRHHIIIILYFENFAFFHAKLGSDVRPRVDNQTSGDTTRFNSTTKWKNRHHPVIHPWVLERVLVAGYGDDLPHQLVRIIEETLVSGNLFSCS